MGFFIHAFVSLFAMLNPAGNVPTYLSMTQNNTPTERNRIALKTTIASACIIVAFLFGGHFIMTLFGISTNAFRIAGGILIFIMGYEMMHAKESKARLHPKEHEDGIAKPDPSVTPLGTPLTAGPGTITTIMALSVGTNWMHILIILGITLIMMIITYFCYRYAGWIGAHLSHSAMTVISRLMGLILTIMAAQMVMEGILGFFH